jgi:heme/copper-type cytochrome/quinol oxidase subunit 4
MYVLQLPLEGLPLIGFILSCIIWMIALVAVANGRFRDNITKLCWFFIILFLNIIGVILFVFWGRKEVAAPEKK